MTEIISTYRLGINAVMHPKTYNGFYVLSPDYPFFSSFDLEEFCEKSLEHKSIDRFIEFGKFYFDNFLIFLLDSPLAYNLMAFGGMSEDKASQTALAVGDLLEKKTKEKIGKEIIFRRFRDIKDDLDFKQILENVREYTRQNRAFATECRSLTLTGTLNKLKRVKNEKGKSAYREALEIAGQYALESVAACEFLYHNFPVEVSKYECPVVIRKIHNGSFLDLADELKLTKIGHIQLSFGGRIFEQVYDDQHELNGIKFEK